MSEGKTVHDVTMALLDDEGKRDYLLEQGLHCDAICLMMSRMGLHEVAKHKYVFSYLEGERARGILNVLSPMMHAMEYVTCTQTSSCDDTIHVMFQKPFSVQASAV